MIQDEEAQVHILEMLTLFWLFFMSATFLIRVHVPDAPSVAHDASLEIAGDDAVRYALGLDAELEGENQQLKPEQVSDSPPDYDVGEVELEDLFTEEETESDHSLLNIIEHESVEEMGDHLESVQIVGDLPEEVEL